ncbi:MAG: bifunctional hydroxymethylpyrimidine kinase/phosphomethylpyrimidine kinase [Desulfomicrobiaceae bacterium]|jgi:hydroxymethylpyrimidine/phosphomethylpyrimidine kinase|nr:bifunctional hydroxymethylpyrimidine kinase/phosphomethylpyrimidine kinase [Desulfomicrobiaceae bacterium]MBC7356687.1 bifunctional hydroxymethylpyrimidine kinase/phosphomethylpyrimidine kinase [Desulfomicrobiaceae bacterium]MBZ4648762.1 bifunctional hydroxymethylpyrimidine kinase/phosphomethylpyrimidine kinase [Desulfomicrobiaceae bacterium]
MSGPSLRPYATVLVIAGSDSCAGAGIQADLKACAALGAYALTVITAVTAQNTRGVRAVHPVPLDMVAAQVEAVLEDIPVAAVKTGMLADPAVVELVAATLERMPGVPVVVDPVMVAQSGDRLVSEAAAAAVRELLLPRAWVLTPNLPEASVLLGREVAAGDTRAAQDLRAVGPRFVLLKGGHGTGGACEDILVGPHGVQRMVAPRLSTPNTHGTGCTLASAIAAGLAQGLDVPEAAARAHGYLQCALTAGAERSLGQGAGPVDHFCVWEDPACRSSSMVGR